MIPNPLERLNSDTYDSVFHYICNTSGCNQNSDSESSSSALLPLSLVCKSLRLETLRWLFREFHWKLHLQKDFLPHNLLTYMRTLRITATNESIDYLTFNKEDLHITFSALKNTRKLIVSGEGGASQLLLSLLALMPALGIVEWNDVPFTNVSCDFTKIAGLFHLSYFESRVPSPRTLELENRHISTIISSSAHTLLHLTLPGRRASPSVLSNCFFPALRTLILTGFAPRTSESPLQQFLDQMPNLQNLQTRLCLGPPFEIYPDTERSSGHIPTKSNPLMLHSLTMYNTVPTDRILRSLPSTLQYLSFAQHPYPYEIIKELGHKFPRIILNSKVSYLNRPKLVTTDTLQHLQHCNLNALRELRLAVSGILLASWFLDLSLALPELETLELHHWHPRTEDRIPSIDHFTPAFAAFNKLRELRLDLHLADEVDNSADEIQKAGSQLSRAKAIALQAAPSLRAVGFMEGHALIVERGTTNYTIFWRMFDITRKHTPTGIETSIKQSEDFRPYQSEEY